MMPMPNRDEWDRLINEFVAADPQVGISNFDHFDHSRSVSDLWIFAIDPRRYR